jgi:hypothetical protein
MNKMNNQDQLSPRLAGLKKENPFKDTAGYFDDFPARMQHRIELEKRSATVRKTRVIDILKPVLGLAASFAALFLLVYWPVKSLNERITVKNITVPTEHYLPDDLINFFEKIDEQTFYVLLEEEAEAFSPETESLVAYLAANFSDYDVFLETQQ